MLEISFTEVLIYVSQEIQKAEFLKLKLFESSIPHLKELANNLLNLIKDEDFNQPFFGIGSFYISSGSPAEGGYWYERCLKLAKGRFQDETHPVYINSLEARACNTYGGLGRYPEAVEELSKVLDLKKKISANKFEISITLHNIAHNLRLDNAGELDESEKFFLESLCLKKEILSEINMQSVLVIDEIISEACKNIDHKVLLEDGYNQGFNIRTPEEKQIYNRLIKHKFSQKEFPVLESLTSTYVDFAILRRFQAERDKNADDKKASLLLREARAFAGFANALRIIISREEPGRLNPDRVWGRPYYWKHLAEVARINEQLDQAENIYQIIWDFCEKAGTFYSVYGPHIGLQKVYMRQNKLKDAERVTRELLGFQKVAYGEKHRYIAITKNKLAEICRKQKKTEKNEEAKRLLQEVIDLQLHLVGENHLDFANSLKNLAWLHQNVFQEYEEAIPLYNKALEIFEHNQEEYRAEGCRKDLAKCSELMKNTSSGNTSKRPDNRQNRKPSKPRKPKRKN